MNGRFIDPHQKYVQVFVFVGTTYHKHITHCRQVQDKNKKIQTCFRPWLIESFSSIYFFFFFCNCNVQRLQNILLVCVLIYLWKLFYLHNNKKGADLLKPFVCFQYFYIQDQILTYTTKFNKKKTSQSCNIYFVEIPIIFHKYEVSKPSRYILTKSFHQTKLETLHVVKLQHLLKSTLIKSVKLRN